MDETKGRNSGSGPSESRRRSDWRRETDSRSWAEKRETNETGQIRDLQQEQILGDAEMQRRSHETESRFLQHKNSEEDCRDYLRNGVCRYGSGCRFNHPPGRNSGSGRRSDWRHETESRLRAEKRENEDSGLRIDETDQIRDHKGNLQEQRQSLRDFEMQRRSHETESRSLQHKNRGQATTLDSGSKRKFDEGTRRMRHKATQSRAYPVRPGEQDCPHFLNFGLCSYGRNCRFNHPTHLRPTCKYFVRGACKYGSACRFSHPMDRDGAVPALFNVPGSPMHRATSSDRRASEFNWRFDDRGHETGSGSRPEKRPRTIPDSRERDPRESSEDISQSRDEKVAGFNRARLEQGHGNIEWQRRESQENVQERRRQIENVEWHKEFMEKQRLRNLEEERLREIERQRRESRMRLDQMQQTVKFDEPHGVEESLRELGTKRREDDGF